MFFQFRLWIAGLLTTTWLLCRKGPLNKLRELFLRVQEGLVQGNLLHLFPYFNNCIYLYHVFLYLDMLNSLCGYSHNARGSTLASNRFRLWISRKIFEGT